MSRAGVALGWSFLEDSDQVDFTALRLDVHGEWLAPDLGIGGYAALPVSYGRIDPEVGPNNAEWVLGDAELGAVVRRTLMPELDLAAHLGVTLPTAPQTTLSSDDITGFASSYAIWARPGDLAQSYGEATFVRAGVSPVHLTEKWFARADLGVDVPVHSGAGDDLTTLGRVNGAVGARVLRSIFMIEIVNVIALEKPSNEGADRVLTFLGLTMAHRIPWTWQPSLTLLFPLDEEVGDAVGSALIFGSEWKLP